MKYALVILLKKPGAFDQPLTYKISEELSEVIKVGQGVFVPLKEGLSRGMVIELSDSTDQVEGTLKPIAYVIQELNLDEVHVNLARQIATYYHSSILRCLKLMLPGFLWKGKGVRILNKFLKNPPPIPDPSIFPLKPLRHALTTVQEAALQKIKQAKKPILIQGVTGSGKTELYLRLMLDTLRNNQQAMLLLPEIALTPQMIDYFSDYFGEYIAVFHSKLSEGQRLSEWLKVKTGVARVVIGSRSAVFAPVRNLGVLIVDEEHEWTYKQESSPYYQTHLVAERLCVLTGAQLIFGTATPRLETYYKAQTGVYDHLLLTERINQQAMPKIEVVDLRVEFQNKNYSIFSASLFNKIKDRLEKKEQIILFVNQRGMARAVVCRDCGHTLNCPHCQVALKLHQSQTHDMGRLMCHYCAYQQDLPLSCPQCESVNIRHVGVGTQRVEQDLTKAFPAARILRADQDTTSDKQGFEPLYHAFKNQEFDILVGTQMVAKGLDFPNVTLIGIILADIGLHIPDFRSHERVFHLITQVAGRAGRSDKIGEVVLQTYQPDHHAIRMAANYQYEAFAAKEISFRKKLNYPPFSQLVKFMVLSPDLEKLKKDIQMEKEILEDIFKVNELEASVLYAPAMIPKVNGFYYYQVLVRTENVDLLFSHWKVPKGWRVDIDPIHTT